MKATILYCGAVALSAASVAVASGINNVSSFVGIAVYSIGLAAIEASALVLAGLGSHLEQKERDRERLFKTHRIHARNPEYPVLPEHTEKGA